MILRKTYGFNKKEDWINFKQLEDITGIIPTHLYRTKKKLLEKNMITCNSKKLGIQKNYEKWWIQIQIQKRPKQVFSEKRPKQVLKETRMGPKKRPVQVHTKEIKKLIQKKYILSAKKLGELILKRKPDYKTVLKQKKKGWIDWADDIRLMVERDKRDPNKIKEIIDWCQQDEFWKNNILSANKLRIQFDKLELKMEDSEKIADEPEYQEFPKGYFNQLTGGKNERK